MSGSAAKKRPAWSPRAARGRAGGQALIVLPPATAISLTSILQTLLLNSNVTSNARVSITLRPLIHSVPAIWGIVGMCNVTPAVSLGIGIRVYFVNTGTKGDVRGFFLVCWYPGHH